MGNKWKNAQRDKRAPYGWQGGFTLIEVLCALALAGLLLSIGMTHYQQHSEAVKQERHQANIALIEGAARRFRLDTGLFPS
ncbi:MAG: prepilin-type N-terminal cleavage/methylation domain-containing protein, partial [Peptococcaceae bacterium]|nr:prepilin-type N-terminal cleavage/methylation domain-containing protein [Peptococcaceae bacterium]